MKSVESKSFEKVPLDAEQLDSEVVAKIEQAANEAFRLDPPSKGVNKKINGAPRNALLKPSDAEHRLSHQRFSLGDRIVYVQDSGRVPIATRGTVVGKTRTSRRTLLDVVFDVTFMSGTSLEDRCSLFRGSTVPIHSVLNLTDRQVVAGSRAGANNRPQTRTPLTAAGYGSPLGPNGQGQLLPAQVPGPLRGSFRSAVSGQTNGMRGGGVLEDVVVWDMAGRTRKRCQYAPNNRHQPTASVGEADNQMAHLAEAEVAGHELLARGIRRSTQEMTMEWFRKTPAFNQGHITMLRRLRI